MIYDRQWFKDVRATLDRASVLKTAPLQNAEPVKPNPFIAGGNALQQALNDAMNGNYGGFYGGINGDRFNASTD